MSDANRDMERDEVLFALHKACTNTNPSAAEIAKWVERFPQYADEIRSHVAIIKDWAAREGRQAPEPDEAMISRSESRAMDALHKARTAAAGRPAAQTFDQIMAATGTNVPDLARKLNIARVILAALVGGRMLAPVGERLVAALTGCWSISTEAFEFAVQLALTAPKLGIPKADSNAVVIPRSYEDLVRASSMSEDRKKYWLGEE